MKVSIIENTELKDRFYFLTILEKMEEKIIGEFNLGLDSDDGNMWLCSIAIKPEYQGRGYGKDATSEIIQLGKFLDFPELHLIVDSDNERAQHVYRECGFEFLPQLDDFYCYEMSIKL